jgi:hypothetical protein
VKKRIRPAVLFCVALSLAVSTALAQDSALRTVHVFVALADNQSQGIVPVAPKLGNGEDPERNLYWGSAYGVKTFFARSADWERIKCGEKPKAEILERCVFKYRAANVYLVADAYRGREIRQTILDFSGFRGGRRSPDGDRARSVGSIEAADSRRRKSCGLHWPRRVDGFPTDPVSPQEK